MTFKMCQLYGKVIDGECLQARFAEKSLHISMAVQLIFNELELKVDISTTLKRTQYLDAFISRYENFLRLATQKFRPGTQIVKVHENSRPVSGPTNFSSQPKSKTWLL